MKGLGTSTKGWGGVKAISLQVGHSNSNQHNCGVMGLGTSKASKYQNVFIGILKTYHQWLLCGRPITSGYSVEDLSPVATLWKTYHQWLLSGRPITSGYSLEDLSPVATLWKTYHQWLLSGRPITSGYSVEDLSPVATLWKTYHQWLLSGRPITSGYSPSNHSHIYAKDCIFCHAKTTHKKQPAPPTIPVFFIGDTWLTQQLRLQLCMEQQTVKFVSETHPEYK